MSKSPAGAEAIVAAQALKRIMHLNLLNSPDSNTRTCILATLDHLSQYESLSPAVMEVDPYARLGRTALDVTRQLHRQAEKALQEAKAEMASQIKVLLLGSSDGGKSAILNQMRLIHRMPFSGRELRSYRQLVFDNLMHGLKYLLDALPDMDLKLPWPDVELIESAPNLYDREPFPLEYLGPLQRLWDEEVVGIAWARRNEIALQENLHYFFSDLLRFFDPAYVPTEQDILHTHKRTKGIEETVFTCRDHEILMIDVDGQRSERRKWIHCFQDVTSILFCASLSGYDQCLVEDRDANQMQDAMTFWDSICHSQWFKQTSIILLLTKNDVFEEKVKTSDIRAFFPDFDGDSGNAAQGRDYFRKRFGKLAQPAGRSKKREIHIHTTDTTDMALMRVIIATVEE
ncbi:heterotrimeric G-protein alpha subunit, GPA2-like protein [Mycena latifolia]|nr:heterotrimeric G-protein alpha subunit, GPA2-like protein [Mycena latifolia]